MTESLHCGSVTYPPNPNIYVGDPPAGTPYIGDPPMPQTGTAVPGVIQTLITSPAVGWKCPQCGYIMGPHMAGCYHCNK
jgi:hypothetical protein